MAAKSHLVSGRSDCSKVKSVIPFERGESRQHEKLEEFMVFSIGNRKHVFDLILLSNIVNRPICMFAASVEGGKWLFVEKNSVAMAVEDFFEDFHRNQIVEDCFSCFFVNGAELKLIVGDLIVLGFERNTNFQKLILDFFEDLFDFLRDFGIVMVRELLTFRSDSSEEAPSRKP